MSSITLGDLNFYHSFLKNDVQTRLREVDKTVSDDIIDNAIKEELKHKLKDEKRFKKEIEALYSREKETYT